MDACVSFVASGLVAEERCARNSESSANNHETKRNVGESGLHPNPPFPSVDYPVKGRPINIPIFVRMSRVLGRTWEIWSLIVKQTRGVHRLWNSPCLCIRFLGCGCRGGCPGRTVDVVGSLDSAGSKGIGTLGCSPACLVGPPAAGRGSSLRVLEEGALCGDGGQCQRHGGDHHVQPNRWPAVPGSIRSVSALNRHGSSLDERALSGHRCQEQRQRSNRPVKADYRSDSLHHPARATLSIP